MSSGTRTMRPTKAIEGTVVLARRWDQLGGRLSAIANARSLAELLGFEFGFVWPRGRDVAVNRPQELFSEEFLARFEFAPEELDGSTAIPYRELLTLDDEERRRRLDEAGPRPLIDVDEVFEIVHGPTDDCEPAGRRYRAAFRTLGWNEVVRELIEICDRPPAEGPIAAVHVRAGDIVDGAWRHVVAHEKYAPTPFVHEAIDRLSHGGERRVLVLSDNARYLAWLRDRYASVTTPNEIVPGYERLTVVQRALADILVLSRCEEIVGPPSSAFSRLAANLADRPVMRLDDMSQEARAAEILRSGIREHRDGCEPSGFWRGLVARDACWYIDVFGDQLTADERLDLARFAADLDPDFAGAQTRIARMSTFAGDPLAARAAAVQALRLADAAERYDDPLFEGLATAIAAKSMAVVQGDAKPVEHESGRHRRETVSIAEMREGLRRWRSLRPFWFERDRAAESLEFLISVAARLAHESPRARRRVGRALAVNRRHAIQMQLLRPSGPSEHRTSPTYDPLRRDLDHLALQAFDALRDAGIQVDPPRLARPGSEG